jgi:GNAT superfamily N-acetyltransferase
MLPMPAVQVRPIAADDAAEVDTLVRRWHGTNVDSYWYNDTHQNHTLDGARGFFIAEVLPKCQVQVALVDGQLAGMTAVQTPWIMQMAVFAEYRRHGVGSALLAAARTLSPAELRLFTFQRNHAARAFYERHDFVLQRLGVSPPPENEPDVEYAWSGPARLVQGPLA